MESQMQDLYTATSPAELVHNLCRSRILSNAILVAVDLGLADLVLKQSITINELATKTGCHQDSLHRLMRCLSYAGIFEEDGNSYTSTELSEVLVKNSRTSIRDLIYMESLDWFTDTLNGLAYSVRTGKPAFDHIHGQDWVEYLRDRPNMSEIMQLGMLDVTEKLELPQLKNYDFSWADTIADVGGGKGGFLAEILKRYPDKRGILAELPEVAEQARNYLSNLGLLHRIEVIEVDMFEELPFKTDACILKRVIHDWDDQLSLKILENCKSTLTNNGRILIIDRVIDELVGAITDLALLVFAGRERTRNEFEQLLLAANLELRAIHSTSPVIAIVETIIPKH